MGNHAFSTVPSSKSSPAVCSAVSIASGVLERGVDNMSAPQGCCMGASKVEMSLAT